MCLKQTKVPGGGGGGCGGGGGVGGGCGVGVIPRLNLEQEGRQGFVM